MRHRGLLLLFLAGVLPLLSTTSCAKGGKAAGAWKATQIGSGGRWQPLRPERAQFLTLGADGKGQLVMHLVSGVKQFPLTWDAAGNTVTVRMRGQVFCTGNLSVDGKSLVTTDIGETQTKWVRTKG